MVSTARRAVTAASSHWIIALEIFFEGTATVHPGRHSSPLIVLTCSPPQLGRLAQPAELVWVADRVHLGDPAVFDDERDGCVVLASGVDTRRDATVDVDDAGRGAGRGLGE